MIVSMTNPLVGHVVYSQGHVILKGLGYHMIQHVTCQVILSQGHVVGE